MGPTFRVIKYRAIPKAGAHTTKISASSAFIQKERPIPMISINGPRTMGRKPPLIAFCRTVTSVVILVIKEDEEK